jgi:hypothetical protein
MLCLPLIEIGNPAFIYCLLAQKRMKELARLNQSGARLFNSWTIRSTSILFLDGCVTSGIIAGWRYEVLSGLGNHMKD